MKKASLINIKAEDIIMIPHDDHEAHDQEDEWKIFEKPSLESPSLESQLLASDPNQLINI